LLGPAFSPPGFLLLKLQIFLHKAFDAVYLALHLHNPILDQNDFLIRAADPVFDRLTAKAQLIDLQLFLPDHGKACKGTATGLFTMVTVAVNHHGDGGSDAVLNRFTETGAGDFCCHEASPCIAS
jgi:hypothetical protein